MPDSTPTPSFYKFTKSKDNNYVCPDCNRKVDREGYTLDPHHCSECPNYSSNEPECNTCGYLKESNQMLSTLVAQDQSERKSYQAFVKTKANGDWQKGAQMYAKLRNRDADDIFGEKDRLQKFIGVKFDFETFTPDDWNNYWLLAQHCDHDRQFQQKALNAIVKYIGRESGEFKYLSDRISCGLNGTQKYGTQDICDKDT